MLALGQTAIVQLGLVEDHVETIEIVLEALAADGAVCVQFVARTVGQALTELKTQRPDVLLVDLGLPDGSGLTVIAAAARAYPSTEILVFSMFGDEQSVLSSVAAGASGYILKDAPASPWARRSGYCARGASR